MNRQRYDPERANALLPLLRVITRELRERDEAVELLERRLLRMGSARATAELRSQVEAALAVHRRELRATQRELERLGCALDADHPLRVLIPGADGDLSHGFAWSPADDQLHNLALASG